MIFHTPNRLPAVGAGFFLLVFLFSCQAKMEPVSPHLEMETLSPDYLVRKLEKRQAGLHDVKSFVRTTVSGQKFKQSFKQTLLVQGNQAIRLDTYGMFGQALGVLIHDPSKTVLYDIEKNRVYQGDEVWNLMQRMIGTHIDLREYIGVFVGAVPRLNYLEVTGARLNDEKTRYQLQAVDRGKNETVLLDLDAYTLLPLRMSGATAGNVSYVIRWQDYEPVGPEKFPHRIEVELPDYQETVTVRYSDLVLNHGLPDDAFELALSP